MNKRILPLLMALCLLCTGCASLLERSYSSVEPYTARFWDSTAEDTLKAESYQDLVNSLLMLIEQRSEEGIIRYYAPEDENSYAQAIRAKHEVQKYTVLGSYLLSGMSVMCAENDGYCTLTYSMTYRKSAQDISALMALTDSQSLIDLLRLALREGHGSITAQFISKTSRDEVLNAVEELWQELYLEELEESGVLSPTPSEPEPALPETDTNGENSETPPSETPPSGEEKPDEDTANTETGNETDSETGSGSDGNESDGESTVPVTEEPTVKRIQYPPCPWEIHFYPDADFPEIVEIVLK